MPDNMFLLILYKSLLVLAIFGITIFVAAYSTYFERKVAAFLQDRLGPNRAGPLGLLQPLADGLKFIMKEELIPQSANKFLFILGPSLAMMTALMAGAVIPWGPTFNLHGIHFPLIILDIDLGVLYVFGIVAMGVYGIMLGGWASNNKFSLLGAIRASAQMISYEVSMGLSILAIVMLTGSLSLKEISLFQNGGVGTEWHFWNAIKQPLSFFIFLISAFAECNRTPFDLPECETELIGGYHTEYSSMKLGFYMFAEYINMFTSSAFMATVYLGSYNFPFMYDLGLGPNAIGILGVLALFIKISFLIFFFMWIRWTLPRFRYDQLMYLGWQILLPLAMLNLLLSSVILYV